MTQPRLQHQKRQGSFYFSTKGQAKNSARGHTPAAQGVTRARLFQLPLFLSPKSINTLWYSGYEPILIMVLLLCGPVTMVYSGFVGRRLFLCIAGVSLLLSFAFLGWLFRSSLLVLFSPKDYFDKLHPFFLLFHNENLNRKVLYWFCFTVVKWSLAISSFLIGLKILLI